MTKRFIITKDPAVANDLRGQGYMLLKEDSRQGVFIFWNEPCRTIKFNKHKCIFTNTLTF